MLADPNDESPANVDAAKEWRENYQEFRWAAVPSLSSLHLVMFSGGKSLGVLEGLKRNNRAAAVWSLILTIFLHDQQVEHWPSLEFPPSKFPTYL